MVDILCRLVNAPLESGLRLHGRELGRHQTEHDVDRLRYEAQRGEIARARVVVFEIEAVRLQRPEHGFRDAFIATFGHPATAGIAAAHVHADPRVGFARADAVVDQSDISTEPSIRRFACRDDLGLHFVRDEIRQQRVVDLDQAATGRFQRRDLGAVDLRDVGKEHLDVGIGRRRDDRAAAVKVHAARRGKSHLGRVHRAGGDGLIVGHDDRLRRRQFRGGVHLKRDIFVVVILPALEARAAAGPDLDAGQPTHEVDPPVLAPELAVGDDGQAGVLLLLDQSADAGILDAAQLRRRDATCRMTRAGLVQTCGSQQ